MSYWFFLSYAHRDAKKNTWFDEFSNQLALEVGRAAALPSNVEESEIGFVDKSGIDLGDDWPETLAEALQSSKVFLCLYSKSFFQSPDCGKEFEIFRSRVAGYEPPANIEAPRLIIPILWDKPNRLPQTLPDAVTNLQYTHADFGEEYARHGLFHLMQMEKKKEVANIISELADRIVNQAKLHPLPRLNNLKPLKQVQSAFYSLPPSPSASVLDNLIGGDLPPSATPPSISGPDVAWYVYFAGRETDYQGKRKNVSCYGDKGGYQWKPFLPPREETIGALTPQIAGKRGLTPQVLPVSRELIKHLKKAEDDNTITVLIVDPWSVKVESFYQLMRNYDEYRLDNCGVIIIWNLDDHEAKERRDELKTALREAFRRNLRVVDEVFRDAVQSEEELVTNLGEVIDKVKTRLLEKSKPARPVPSNGGESFPNLNGTSGAR